MGAGSITHQPSLMTCHLSAAILAHNEERHIAGCLASLAGLADEVVVLLDTRSNDATAQICAQYGARVERADWISFPAQRNQLLDHCRGEWVLFIDADEEVTAELAHEIKMLPAAPAQQGYWIPRYNLFFGQRLRGGGWYPDHQLRLLRRRAARYDEQQLVHEVVHIDGSSGHLQQHLLHHNIERLDEFWRKQSRYALAEARMLQQAGRRVRWRNYAGAPLREFYRRYVRLGGWRDGALGLFLCAALAWFEIVKFACLHLLQAPAGRE